MSRETGNIQNKLFQLDDIKIFEIINTDENPPVFYNPANVIKVAKWLFNLSYVSIFIIVLSGIPKLANAKTVVDYWLSSYPMFNSLGWLITGFIVIIGLILQYFLYVFGLRAVANLLGILMEIEYNSRK